MTFPGPDALGRAVVVAPGAPAPAGWEAVARVRVDEAALAEPGGALEALQGAFSERRRVVVELGVDAAALKAPEADGREPYLLTPEFSFRRERLHFLVWANAYDCRSGEPVWWWTRKAERLGAAPGGPADVLLPDGRPAWVDGGPRAPFDPAGLGAEVVHRETVEAGRLSVAPAPRAPAADLAPDQLDAVAHRSGPARVIAPAGSGKTRVLTERLRHLVVDRGVERELVLAVAYNVKAKEEMEARCADFRPRVQTLNGLGYGLLAQARGRAPAVLEEREVRRIVERLVPRTQRRVNTDPLAPYLEALSAVRLGLRPPEEVEASRDDVPGLADAFGPYRRALADADAVDFDEQVYAAAEALLSDPAFRARAQAGARHLLVDEFQDLTPAHVLLLRLLASPGLDVFGVGDDDQTIYGHVGADPGFLIDFAGLFPGAVAHPLEVNYRCPVAVVDGARTLLSYNARRVAKEIRSGPAADPEPAALAVRLHAPEAGADALVETVRGWLGEPGVAPADVAVLTRVNSLLLAPHVALAEAGVAVSSVLRPDVLERTGVRAALAYLRIGADPERIDGGDVVEVYRRPSRGFPQWFPKWLNRRNFTFEALRAIAKKLDDDKVAAKVHALVDDLEAVAEAVRGGGTTRSVLAVVKDEVGLGKAMSLLDSYGGEGASQLDDLEALEQVAALHPDPTSFEPWLRTVFHREAAPGGVTLSTVHRVKGMEWDRVAVFGATAGLVPHRLADDDEEERRVLHVAVTRGRHRVAVLGDATRPSPFLDELAGRAPRRPASRPAAPAAAKPAAAPKTAPVEARVGLALEANGGYKGTVAALDDDGASLRLDSGGTLRVRYGDLVKVRGRTAPLAPRPELPPEAEAAEDALRAWRTDRCRRDKVSAFIVLTNASLRAVATARPATLEELARVEGIGPTKLELYGDEILGVLEGQGP